MMYLSQLLGKNIYFDDQPFAKIFDMAINEHELLPSVTKIEVKKGDKKMMISSQAIAIQDDKWILVTKDLQPLSHEDGDFYLSEDLLDKQVIDIDGRRLVRVNDILLDINGNLKVKGLDVGIAGILRRLGLGRIKVQDKVLPWNVIEAFDYDTGSIRLKLKQNSLNTFHPSELADILEDVGTKERIGIVASLDARQAAKAIEESDEETQVSILEGLTQNALKDVLNKMDVSEIADVFHDVNPSKLKEIQQLLGAEKVQKVKGLLRFPDNVAGGLMHETFFTTPQNATVTQLKEEFSKLTTIPESIIVIDKEKFLGTFLAKDLLRSQAHQIAKDLITDRNYLSVHDNFTDIIELFSQYNLRELPVIDSQHKPIGIVHIDEILKIIDEENQKDDNH